MTPNAARLAAWMEELRRQRIPEPVIARIVTSWRAGQVAWGVVPGSIGEGAMTYIGASEAGSRSAGLYDYAPEVSEYTLQGLDVGGPDGSELGQFETVARVGGKIGRGLVRLFRRKKKKKKAAATPARPFMPGLPAVPVGTAIGSTGLLIAGGIVLLALTLGKRR